MKELEKPEDQFLGILEKNKDINFKIVHTYGQDADEIKDLTQ